MNAHFGRKIPDMEALQAATRQARQEKNPGSVYTVTREVELNEHEFKKFAEDLLWKC